MIRDLIAQFPEYIRVHSGKYSYRFFFKDGSKRKRQSLTKSYHHSTQEHYLSITQNYLETGHKILD